MVLNLRKVGAIERQFFLPSLNAIVAASKGMWAPGSKTLLQQILQF